MYHSANEIENNLDDNGLFLSQKLSDISAIKGFKIVHQNIRSLTGRIDELRLIASELRSSMSFSETWAHKDIADSELEIPGYKENLTQLINQPTRITQYSKTLLDIIITNYPHNIRECGVLSLSLSDHDMVFCIRKLNWMKAAPETKIFRNYAKYDPAKFCEDLRSVNWVDGMNSSGTANENVICVDKLWLNFKSAFLKVADCHAPLIQKRVRGVDNCPWMTGQIKKDIRQRDFLLKKARKSSHDEHWLAYKSMRNCVTNSVKRAKQTYNRKLIDNYKDDTKAFWRTMKKIIPGNKISGGSKNIIIEGVLCSEASDGKKIVNSFNNVFASAAARLKRTLGSVSFEKGGVGRKLNGSVTIYLRIC